MQTYKHSGIIPIGGAILAIIAGAVTAFFGGILYAFIIVWCPVIYFCVLATFGFGAAIGGAIGYACKSGKVRNDTLRLGLTFVFATIGIYCEWGATSNAIGNVAGWKNVSLLGGFNPVVVGELIEFLYEEGSWGLGRGGSVSGIFLVLFWVAEVLMIYIAAFYTCGAVADDLPFCETCNQWTQWTREMYKVQSDGKEPLWQQVQMGDLNPALELPPAHDSDETFVRFDAATCASCGQTAFLSAYLVTLTFDDDGDVDKDEEAIVRHVAIDDSHIIKLMEANNRANEQFADAPPVEPGESDKHNNDLVE